MELKPQTFGNVELLPMWDGTFDSRFPMGFLDGSGITVDYKREPAEWDHALLVYKVAKSHGWSQEQAQEVVRGFKLLVRRGERSSPPVFRGYSIPSNAQEQQHAYWLALGQFIHAYADMEGMLFSVFRELGRINRRTGRALFAGSNAGELIGKIKALLKIGDESKDVVTGLHQVLDQLLKINQARNSLLHYGWQYSDAGEMVSTNLRMALHPTNIRGFSATPETLDDMRADLGTIRARLFLFMWRNLKTDAIVYKQVISESEAVWKYKPF